MSWDYVEKKIQEALHLTRGNQTRARQQIIAWAMDDPKLLQTLVKPHMVGITAHAIGRVVSGKSQPEPVAQAAPLRATPPQSSSPSSSTSQGGYNSTGRTPTRPMADSTASDKSPKKKQESFGMDILKTIAGGNTAQFGQENYNPPRRKQGVSQKHIDAIRAMAKKLPDDNQ
jgi:hypothetical protein